MYLSSIPAFSDNYIWILHNNQQHCLIVDPGDAQPVLETLHQQQWQPQAIMLTHHHQDHTAGVAQLRQHYPQLIVYGPAETAAKGASQLVQHGDRLHLLGLEFQVLATPGHTLGHICYFSDPWLFCGDTLFSAGCGRLFEGSAAQMHHSLQQLNQLPAHTLICCGHEYTANNLKFALSLLPENQNLTNYYEKVVQMRQKNQQTLPSTLQTERQINLFLNADNLDFMRKINPKLGQKSAEQRFAWLRQYKDQH